MSKGAEPAKVRGRSLRGKDLRGHNFRNTDIRGADFRGAQLQRADFSNAKAGVRRSWQAVVVLVSVAGSVVAGSICGYVGGLIGLMLFVPTALGTTLSLSAGIAFVVALPIFIVLGIRYGVGRALGLIAMGLVALAAVVATSGTPGAAVAAIIPTFAMIAAVAALILWLLGILSVDATVGDWAAVLLIMAGLGAAVPGAIEGVSPGGRFTEIEFDRTLYLALGTALLVVLLVLAAGLYISRSRRANRLHTSALDRLISSWVGVGGTSFRHADLTQADFSGAHLGGADLRDAALLCTCWHNAQGLEQARIDGTYLQEARIRQLLITKNGEGADLDRQQLRGVNLAGADLRRASLIGADLSKSTLEGADLTNAKLAKAQLYKTNLSNACLTGAVIEDWALSTDTVFTDLHCEYIYMRLPTEDDPDPWRKPDSRDEVFKEGDFADFIAPIIRTLDLYSRQNVDPRRLAGVYTTLDLIHYEGIDPAVAALTLKQLAAAHPEANLEVIALEGHGGEKVRLQAAVTDSVDRSALNTQYFEQYHHNAALPEQDRRALLTAIQEKDARIRSLEAMVTSAMESERFYVETYYALGDTVGRKSTINIQAGGDVSGVVGGDVTTGGDFIGRDHIVHGDEIFGEKTVRAGEEQTDTKQTDT